MCVHFALTDFVLGSQLNSGPLKHTVMCSRGVLDCTCLPYLLEDEAWCKRYESHISPPAMQYLTEQEFLRSNGSDRLEVTEKAGTLKVSCEWTTAVFLLLFSERYVPTAQATYTLLLLEQIAELQDASFVLGLLLTDQGAHFRGWVHDNNKVFKPSSLYSEAPSRKELLSEASSGLNDLGGLWSATTKPYPAC